MHGCRQRCPEVTGARLEEEGEEPQATSRPQHNVIVILGVLKKYCQHGMQDVWCDWQAVSVATWSLVLYIFQYQFQLNCAFQWVLVPCCQCKCLTADKYDRIVEWHRR